MRLLNIIWPKQPVPICVNCKSHTYLDYCSRPDDKVWPVHPVTGLEIRRRKSCYIEREKWFGCGPSGRYFEAKDANQL